MGFEQNHDFKSANAEQKCILTGIDVFTIHVGGIDLAKDINEMLGDWRRKIRMDWILYDAQTTDVQGTCPGRNTETRDGISGFHAASKD